MRFKDPRFEQQFKDRPAKLREICLRFDELSHQYGVDPVVTRVTDTVKGESGVHPAGRAVDFRQELRYFDKDNKPASRFLYKPEDIEDIARILNKEFPRSDGKKVCIVHGFQGGPIHAHIQIPLAWA